MILPVQKQGCESISNQQGLAKEWLRNIKDEIKHELPRIAVKKGLTLEDIIRQEDMDDDLETNQEMIDELLAKKLIKEPKYGKCFLMDGNIVEVKQGSKDNKYIYVSKNYNDGTCLSLNLVDIFKIFYQESDGQIKTRMAKYYGYRTKEENRKGELKKIYTKNREKIVIEKDTRWKEDYKDLHEIGKSTFETLIQLNIIAENTILEGIRENHAFFAAGEYIAEELTIRKYTPEKRAPGKRTIGKHINMLLVLGIIRLGKPEDISSNMLERSKVLSKKKGHYYIPYYYIIEELTDEILEEANKIAKTLKANGLNVGNITKDKIKDVFGQDGVLRVYGNNEEIIDYMAKISKKGKKDKLVEMNDEVNKRNDNVKENVKNKKNENDIPF